MLGKSKWVYVEALNSSVFLVQVTSLIFLSLCLVQVIFHLSHVGRKEVNVISNFIKFTECLIPFTFCM